VRECFRVIHPYHPLFGQEFRILEWRRNWTEDRVYFLGPNDVQTSIYSRWTDLVAQDPLVVIAAGRSCFRVQDLLELCCLIEDLKRNVRQGA
jgi:hypothetical protein